MKKYGIYVDGFEITSIDLDFSDYCTQIARNAVRKKIARFYNIPSHYIRLVPKVRKGEIFIEDLQS